MSAIDVYVSVGAPASDRQDELITAIESRLRGEGMEPHTLGRNEWSHEAPLRAIANLMDKCSGTVVIALERTHFEMGVEKRKDKISELKDVRLPTPWNHIEAAMAYSRGQPLMVIVEDGLKPEGLLEDGHDWYVQSIKPEIGALATREFASVLSSWKQKLRDVPARPKDLSDFTLGDILKLRAATLWKIVGALTALLAGAFALGAKLFTAK